jgi:hypothetical protein
MKLSVLLFTIFSTQSSHATSCLLLVKSVDFEESSSAAALHAAGHSAYCRAPAGLEQSLVRQLLEDTGFGLGCFDLERAGAHDLARGEVEMFYSAKGHITDWHFDFQVRNSSLLVSPTLFC